MHITHISYTPCQKSYNCIELIYSLVFAIHKVLSPMYIINFHSTYVKYRAVSLFPSYTCENRARVMLFIALRHTARICQKWDHNPLAPK